MRCRTEAIGRSNGRRLDRDEPGEASSWVGVARLDPSIAPAMPSDQNSLQTPAASSWVKVPQSASTPGNDQDCVDVQVLGSAPVQV